MKMGTKWEVSVVNQYMQYCFQTKAILKSSLHKDRSSAELSGTTISDHTQIEAFFHMCRPDSNFSVLEINALAS